jgi:hypothetical protein
VIREYGCMVAANGVASDARNMTPSH